jgi:phage gp29-like protein
MVPRLQSDLQPAVAEWAEQLQALVAEAGSLEAIQAGLLELAPQLSLDKYAEAMAEALTAADLAGRNDIEDEAR